MASTHIDYVVMTTDPRDHQHDHGSWSLHGTEEEARELAKEVRGRVYRVTREFRDDDSRTETFERLYRED